MGGGLRVPYLAEMIIAPKRMYVFIQIYLFKFKLWLFSFVKATRNLSFYKKEMASKISGGNLGKHSN